MVDDLQSIQFVDCKFKRKPHLG